MKKFIFICLLAITCFSILASCKTESEDIKNNDTEIENEKNHSTEVSNESAIWSSEITLGIVAEQDTDWDFYGFMIEIYSLTGKIPTLISEDSTPYDHEFVFGETSREISKSAYLRLERILSGEVGEVGWLIYSDGSSLAVAFNCSYAMQFAFEYINSNLLTEATLKLDKGVVASDVFAISKYAEEYRKAERDKRFLELEKDLGKEITNQLRSLYSLYNDDIYVWLANLYDYEIGGFYFSNSARNNEGYLPDLESTAQALNHLASGGMFEEYENSYGKGVSDDMRKQITTFVLELQSSVNGFFYHPQWGTDIVDSRRGRDLQWASQLLESFDEKPLYNTPGGMKGSLGDPPGVASVSKLTNKLSTSTVSAISKVVSVSSVNLPWYLRSLAEWEKYIADLDIPNNSYSAGNTLAAQYNEIRTAGQEYIDYLINYLNDIQIPELGLWQKVAPGEDNDYDPNDGVNFNTVDGLMKIACVYNYFKVPVPNIENAFTSCIKVALYPDDETDIHVCSTYNPWITMGILLESAKISFGEWKVQELRSIVLDNAVALISATVDKLIPHVREDGCFSFYESRPCLVSQKAPVACAEGMESDVNGTTICATGISTNIFKVLGVDYIPLYYAPDREYFYSIIDNLGPVLKDPVPPVETITFEEKYEGEIQNGTNLEPAPSMTVGVPNTTILNGEYKYHNIKVVSDPIPKGLGDKALKVNNNTYLKPDGSKDTSTGAASIFTEITNSQIFGNTYTYSFDMLVTKANNGCFAQLYFIESVQKINPSFCLNFYGYAQNGKQYVKIQDGYDGPDLVKDTNVVSELPFEKWFNIRLELYKIYGTMEDGRTSNDIDIIVKIYIDNEFVGTSESSYTDPSNPTVVKNTPIGAIRIAPYRTNDSEFYLDNVYAAKSNESYIESVIPPEPAPEFVAVPNGERGKGVYYNGYKNGEVLGITYDYNNGEKKPSVSSEQEAKIYIAGLTDTTDSSTPRDGYAFFYRLGLTTKHEYVNYAFGTNTKPSGVANPVSVAEMDMSLGNIDAKLPVLLRIYANGIRQSIYFTQMEGGIGFANVSDDSYFVPLEWNKWYNFRFETYVLDLSKALDNSNVVTKVYVNGEYFVELSGVDVATTNSACLDIQMQYTNANAWLCYDNLYLGYADKAYVDPVPPASPEAPENKEYTNNFDSEDALEDYTITNNHEGYFNATIVDNPNAEYEGDKAFLVSSRIESALDNGASCSFIKIPVNGNIGNCYVLSYDFKLNTADGWLTKEILRFNFNNSSDATVIRNLFEYTAGGDRVSSETTNLDFRASNSQGSDSYYFISTNMFADSDKWYNVRIEIHRLGSKKYATLYYVDDVLVGKNESYVTDSNISYLSIELRNNSADIYFDNLLFERMDKAYVEPEDSINGSLSGTGVYFADNSKTGYRADFSTIDKPTGNGITLGKNLNVPIDKYSLSNAKVYRAAYDNGYALVKAISPSVSSTIGQANIVYNPRLTNNGSNNALVVEMDMAFCNIKPEGEFKYVSIISGFDATGKKGDVYISSPEEGKILIGAANTISDGTRPVLDADKWYNIRFEYHLNGFVRVYIDGDYACTFKAASYGTDTSSKINITLHQHADEEFIAYDNLYVGYDNIASN